MPEVQHIITALNAGELSPRLLGRVNFDKYQVAAEKMQNYIPQVHGGADNRAGSRFVAKVKDATKDQVLTRFEFNTQQAYMLELGPLYFRFLTSNGQLTVPDTDAAVTNGSFTTDITGWTDKSTGTGSISHDSTNKRLNLNGDKAANKGIAEQLVTIGGGFTSALHVLKFQTFSSRSLIFNGEFTDNIDGWDDVSVGLNGDADSGTKISHNKDLLSLHFSVASGTAAAEQKIKITDDRKGLKHVIKLTVKAGSPDLVIGSSRGASDILNQVGLAVASHEFSFTPNVSEFWIRIKDTVIADVDDISLTTGVKLRIGATSGASDIVADTTFEEGFHCVQFTPGGTSLYIQFESEIGAQVDEVAFLDNVPLELPNPYAEVDLRALLTAQSADVMWITNRKYPTYKLKRLGTHTWSLERYQPAGNPFIKAGDYPGAVAFYEQRLLLGGTTNKPQTIWGTKAGDFESIVTGIEDDAAFEFTLAVGGVDDIVWLSSLDKGIIVGTAGAEITMTGTSDSTITPTKVLVKGRTTHGSRLTVAPVRIGNSLVFLQRAGKKLREFVFNIADDAFTAPDLTLLAEHLVRKFTLKQIAFKEEPTPTIWAVRSDGVLLSMTIDREQDVVGLAPHPVGGSFGSGGAVVESANTIPHPNGNRDQLWVIVKRTINSLTEKYIEFLGEEEGSFYTALQVDSGLVGNTPGGAASITGLGHLEGETVRLLGDGADYGNFTVASGSITGWKKNPVDYEVGYLYSGKVKTLKAEVLQGTTAQGLLKQRPDVFVRVTETLGIKINGQTLPERKVQAPIGQPPALVTGDLKVTNLGWSRGAQVEIERVAPLPSSILSIFGKMNVEG